jgi:hypothetical protein
LEVTRQVIRKLTARDAVNGSEAVFPPGTSLSDCRIISSVEEPYLMQFEVSGRHYTCPLFYFQPKTQAVVDIPTEVDAGCANQVVQR